MTAIVCTVVCVSQGLPHWWHFAIISSVILSPKRLSNTKFLPINFEGMFLFDVLRVIYNATFQMKNIFKPIVQHVSTCFLTANATVQYIIIFFSSLPFIISTAIGNCSRKVSEEFLLHFQNGQLHIHNGCAYL